MRILRRSDIVFKTLLVGLLSGAAAVLAGQAGSGWAWAMGGVTLLLALGTTMRKPLRRWRLAAAGLTPAQAAWLDANLPWLAHFAPDAQARFRRDVAFFLAERRFERRDGALPDPQHALAVAAGAALLLHGRPDWEWTDDRSVVFYPDRFDDSYSEDTDEAEYDGMVHPQGPILLSEPAVEESWRYPHDGYNVVLHELAHLFDFADSSADGYPVLLDPASAEAWRKLMRREIQAAKLGKSLLPRYAGTNGAELFACATEQFFERPALLAQHHADLYAALSAFYQLDPRRWHSPDAETTAPRRGSLIARITRPTAP